MIRCSAHAGDELDVVLEAEPLDGGVAGAARLALADDDEVDVVALGAQLGHRLEQELEALHGDVGRRGGDEAAGDDARPRAAA